jgi:hypothetical protein
MTWTAQVEGNALCYTVISHTKYLYFGKAQHVQLTCSTIHVYAYLIVEDSSTDSIDLV